MVQALYCPCIGIPAFIIDNSIIAVVVYGVTFQSSAVDRFRGPRHFVCPFSVVFFDAVELA